MSRPDSDPIERAARVASETDCKMAQKNGEPCPWELCPICKMELHRRLV